MRNFIFISLIILLANTALASSGSVYLLDLHYDNGQIILNKIEVINGFSPDNKLQSGSYKLEVISVDKQSLYSFNFKAPRIYADRSEKLTGEIDGAVIDLNQADFTLIAPFFNDGKDIKIYKDNNEVFSTDISQFNIQQSPKKKYTWFYVALVVILIILVLIRIRTNKFKYSK